MVHSARRLELAVAEDNGEIKYRSAPLTLERLTLFFDRGVVEVFANGGAVCGTRRTYKITGLTSLEVKCADRGRIQTCEAWGLRG